jgi:hypothetical protein
VNIDEKQSRDQLERKKEQGARRQQQQQCITDPGAEQK